MEPEVQLLLGQLPPPAARRRHLSRVAFQVADLLNYLLGRIFLFMGFWVFVEAPIPTRLGTLDQYHDSSTHPGVMISNSSSALGSISPDAGYPVTGSTRSSVSGTFKVARFECLKARASSLSSCSSSVGVTTSSDPPTCSWTKRQADPRTHLPLAQYQQTSRPSFFPAGRVRWLFLEGRTEASRPSPQEELLLEDEVFGSLLRSCLYGQRQPASHLP